MPVEIRTVLGNTKKGFTPIEDVERYEGHPEYVEGSIVMTVERVPLLREENWDDVNWLWPFVVQASMECEETGSGSTSFPDQPVDFRVEALPARRLRLTLSATNLHRTATTSAPVYYGALATAGLFFFEHLERLVPRATESDQREIAALRRWSSAGP